MSISLISTNRDVDHDARAKADWAVITAIAEHGIVLIDEDVVNSIGRLLDGQALTNGQTVTAYVYGDDEPYPALISAFGPSLLPTMVQDQVRDRLARGEAGKTAVRMFDAAIRLNLQVSLCGDQGFLGAHLKGVNWPADEVEIKGSSHLIHSMLEGIGVAAGSVSDEHGRGEVAFDVLAKAVNDNAPKDHRLHAFVACGRRQGATHAYWA